MSSFYPAQTTFSRGEISPLLGGRIDVDFWRQSLHYLRNWQVLTHGGLRRRSGFRFVAEVDNSAQITRLLPFSFSETQSYVLEVGGGGQIRFIAERGVVESGGSPYSISHSYAGADIFRLSYAQFNDKAYFAHKAYRPQELTRMAETNWSLGDVVFEDGPYLDANATGTTLTPSSTGHATPKMTGLTAPSGTVASSGSSATAWRAFNRDKAVGPDAAAGFDGSTGWVSYDFGAGNEKTVDNYWITAPNDQDKHQDMFKQWEFQASNDGSTWVTLDSRDGEEGWSSSETRYFETINKTPYRYYRIKFSGGGGADETNGRCNEIAFHQAATEQTPFNLTASSTAGINGGTGFVAADVGRSIRLLASDGRWRWAKITSRISPTVVKIVINDQALPDASPIVNWRLGAFSESSGYPGAVALYNERLMWARTDAKPVTVYGSKQGDFEDYGTSDPLLATDGINITLISSNMNEILWIVDDEDLITGSAKQVRSVGPSDTTQSFSATNITQRKGPNSGASHIHPLSIGGVVLYVGAGGTKIRELLFGEQNRYVAPELSLIGEHYFRNGIVDWAYSEKPDPVIYAVTGDGLLVAMTYDREQKVLGFSRHDLGGVVESVAIIPSIYDGFDDIYVVVRRTINGQTKRYIEVMERPFDPETDDVKDGFFVDSGLTYSGAPATTITGLDHLEGESVIALADGNVVRDLTVSSGQITLPYEASKVHVGLAMKSRAITLPVVGPGRDGTIFGRRANVISGNVNVYGTGSLKVGPHVEGQERRAWEQILKTGDTLFGNEVELFTGFKRCDMEGSWVEGNGMVNIETDEPLPAILRAFIFQLENEP